MDTDLVPIFVTGGTILTDMGSTFFIMDLSGNKSVVRKVQIYPNADYSNGPITMSGTGTSLGFGVGFLYLANPNPEVMRFQNITGMN